MDLPSDDPRAGLQAFRDTVLRALEPYPGDIVLVGHSFGGVTIPHVAAVRPTRRMVFVCAVTLLPGKTRLEMLREDPSQITPAVAEALKGGRPEPPGAADGIVTDPDCSPEDVELVRRNRRGVSREEMLRGILAERSPLVAWPAVDCRYVLATKDRAVMPDWSRRFARGFLGVEPIEIEGGHMLPLNHPRELAEAIVGGLR